MRRIVIISKDAMCADYLPVYGNQYNDTPNIDAVAKQGTVFRNYYAAAPSSVMSFYSMITGQFAHETPYEMYERTRDVFVGDTLFTKLKRDGYRCHLVWNSSWAGMIDYYDCYRNDVEIHGLPEIKQSVGSHYSHTGFLKPDPQKAKAVFDRVLSCVEGILSANEDTFLWIHLPHVLNGEVSYGSDIQLFDRYVGAIRQLVPDDCITITADHGNMNGHRGKICYGFDVYQPAIRIPLITPRIDHCAEYTMNTSNVDLYSILTDRKAPERTFVYSDTAFRAQKHRKLAIIYDKYKYIYNKQTNTEELYDLIFDPTEQFSVADDYIFDVDRKVKAPSRELYFYPEWDKLPEIRGKLRAEKERIWMNGSAKIVLKSNVKDALRPLYERLTRKKLPGA